MPQFVNEKGEHFEAEGMKFSDWLKSIKPVNQEHKNLLDSVISALDW